MEGRDFENRGDLKISGSGSVGGGNYNYVKISGAGRVNGSIDCRELSISGAGKILGDIKAEEVSISGSGKIEGATYCNDISVSGGAKFSGDVQCKSISTSGSCKVDGGLKSEDVSISGSLSIDKKIEAEVIKISGLLTASGLEGERFYGSGIFKIEELLNADKIDISMMGRCEAKEIGGEVITIKRDSFNKIGGLFQSLFISGYKDGSLQAETIEGDELYLEHTTAKVVRGDKVVIGPGCNIELAEYKSSLQVSEKSRVKNEVHLGE